MIRGLEKKLKPFLKTIILEDKKSSEVNNFSQLDRYYKKLESEPDYEIRITMEMCIKMLISSNYNGSFARQLITSLDQLHLNVLIFDDRSRFANFLTTSTSKKQEILKEKKDKIIAKKISFSKTNIGNYVSIVSDDAKRRVLSIPIDVTTSYGENLNYSNKNPGFLAFAFYLSVDGQPLLNTINHEIIFSSSAIHDISGYFEIGNAFSYMGQVSELTQQASPINTRLLNRVTGETLIPGAETDRNQQVNYLFGSPGDIWTGPVHTHPITDATDPDFGGVRVMAGAAHNSMIPHPFLNYVTSKGNKVVDFRSISSFEDVFSYKSKGFQELIDLIQDATYTQQKRQNFIGDLVRKKSIVSEEKISIRQVTRRSINKLENYKDNIVIFFAIDKKKLLRETTKLPQLLEKLVEVKESFYKNLINEIEIFHFEITRINKNTGQSKSLIVGNNDNYFNDYDDINQLKQNNSKNFVLENITNKVLLQSNDERGINLYQFTDGEIDAKHDNNKYCYEIKIKFRDPLIKYLTQQLLNLREIIQDVDELIEKTNSVMIDTEVGRQVRVYDEFQKQLNPTFVSQCLLPPARPILPLEFSFNPVSELPISAENALLDSSSLQSLNFYFFALNLMSCSSSYLTNDRFANTIDNINYLNNLMASLLKLSTTSPQKLQKARDILDSLRNKTQKLLSIFSVVNVTKKSLNFTDADYLKSSEVRTKNTANVIEFKYSFKKAIDLSKVKDYFDWIEEAPHVGTDGGIKKITPAAYKSLVQNKNIVDNLTAAGLENFKFENNFSYSFLPYSSPSVLNLQKNNTVDIQSDFLQAIRKKIIGGTASSLNSVLIPEILCNFGIRFINFKDKDKMLFAYVEDSSAYNATFIPINNAFEDNFGSTFVSKEPELNDNCSSALQVSPSGFGATENLNYAWQGGTYKNYPFTTAMSLISLINTKALSRKRFDFVNKTYSDLLSQGIISNSTNTFSNKELPFALNLFSSDQMLTAEVSKSYLDNIITILFNSNDMLRFENYYYYTYLLNLFAKVYYLKDFHTREDAAFGNNFRKFKATTKQNNMFVKHMQWEPLDLSVIENVQPGRQILCKLMLFDGHKASSILDQKVIRLFDDFYNYNKMFFIGRQENESTFISSDDSPQAAALEVQSRSSGTNTRKILNDKISLMSDKIIAAHDEKSMKSTAAEDKAIKDVNQLTDSSVFTYNKLST